ncbi:hypothetical protein H0H81_009843 [Sphagnurus paluster]|uniref:Uncharacterized protein n=1 Tax=Sphagnurus paluster TaxID=117069 RepID=A0A9P7FV68_9AGAR|nr:hypothetical protein H0H81_009843 [Sphagnurus paluster]
MLDLSVHNDKGDMTISPVLAGVIGALSTLVVVASVAVAVLLFRRRHEQQARREAEDTERVSLYVTKPDGETEPETTYIGLRGASIDEGSRTPGRSAAPALRLSTELDPLDLPPALKPRESDNSIVSLPQNLYMPVSVRDACVNEWFCSSKRISVGSNVNAVACCSIVAYGVDTRGRLSIEDRRIGRKRGSGKPGGAAEKSVGAVADGMMNGKSVYY